MKQRILYSSEKKGFEKSCFVVNFHEVSEPA